MKVQNITDVDKFCEVVSRCKGKVELVTGEGDRLNLKSRLRRYVALDRLFSDSDIEELEVLVSEPEDVTKLVNFLMETKEGIE